MTTWNIEELSYPEAIDDDAAAFLVLFASELKVAAERFQEASQRGDLVEASRLCRRMRGSAALYGFKNFAERLWRVEILIDAGERQPASVAGILLLIAGRIGIRAYDSAKY